MGGQIPPPSERKNRHILREGADPAFRGEKAAGGSKNSVAFFGQCCILLSTYRNTSPPSKVGRSAAGIVHSMAERAPPLAIENIPHFLPVRGVAACGVFKHRPIGTSPSGGVATGWRLDYPPCIDVHQSQPNPQHIFHAKPRRRKGHALATQHRSPLRPFFAP